MKQGSVKGATEDTNGEPNRWVQIKLGNHLSQTPCFVSIHLRGRHPLRSKTYPEASPDLQSV